jgi:hypothetical protein
MPRILYGFLLFLCPLFPFQKSFAQVFTSSNLPIVIINTGGQTIIDEPKIAVQLSIIDNGPGIRNNVTDVPNNYNNYAGIELRGSSSQSFPQKSYGFETWGPDSLQLDVPLLGMPAEHDWILYAPYNDKTLIRNILTYDLSRQMGHYSSRTKLCELIVDGQYEGVYVLMEKIKRDKNRVDISRLDTVDISGDALTGGYIFKVDKTTGNGGGGWYSSFAPAVAPFGQQIYFQYSYPKDDIIRPEQKTYIQDYVNDFETALAGTNYTDPVSGYRNYIDVNSFIDFFIINEASKNVDGYRLSTYLYKEKITKSGKIFIGPVWDYNLAWWNADYCSGQNYYGWAYNFGQVCPWDGGQVPFWWRRLLQDPAFSNQLKCRWSSLRNNSMSLASLNTKIDSLTNYLSEAQVRHFQRWPILGQYTWPNPSPIATTYSGEISNLKTWLSQRFGWMDTNMFGSCTVTALNSAAVSTEIKTYPNPFRDELNFELMLTEGGVLKIELLNALGQTVKLVHYKGQAGENIIAVSDLNDIPAGSYFLKVNHAGGSYFTKLVKY